MCLKFYKELLIQLVFCGGFRFDKHITLTYTQISKSGATSALLQPLHFLLPVIFDAAFFCTKALIEWTYKHKLTNFRFISVEERHGFENESKYD